MARSASNRKSARKASPISLGRSARHSRVRGVPGRRSSVKTSTAQGLPGWWISEGRWLTPGSTGITTCAPTRVTSTEAPHLRCSTTCGLARRAAA